MNILKLFGFGKKVTKIEPVIDTRKMHDTVIDEFKLAIPAKDCSIEEILGAFDEEKLPMEYRFYSEEHIEKLVEHEDDTTNEREAYMKEQAKLDRELYPSSENLSKIHRASVDRKNSSKRLARKAMVKKNGN